ncbi:alkene reductase [Polymorphobacter arshaanensis]|uniref:Alkene reductase n=1 Tax=Glacieibacterium arshaanense TaxID=2511025 RepID=A0A4Y9ESJ1_9SPHN|nr:alkene reductase [Polymorphobacter arshaanensis]TFU05868.1 alkene reductase [Polymorphobacter arshaanensis]
MSKTIPAAGAASLFDPLLAGDLKLGNRIVMAPLTRNRAGPGLVPGPFAAEYYAQRASAGLIIAEATQVSAQAQGYSDTPGCYTDAQVAGWKVVTDAVHAKGGVIVLQLWHCGRISHTVFQDGAAPVGPSAIRANGRTFVAGQGFVDVSKPRALRLDELPGIVADFRHAARCAISAGFDGVEIHGAHGYLLDAFLRDGTNHRTDAYGGSVANRARLLVEVTTAVAEEIGAGRLGVRLSPVSTAGDSRDNDPQVLFNYVVAALDPIGLAYLHVVEGETGGPRDSIAFDYAALRQRFSGVWMANNGYDRAIAIAAIAAGTADLISFGRPFITNPDLVRRLCEDAPLTPLTEPATIYGGGALGYTDYPALGANAAAA